MTKLCFFMLVTALAVVVMVVFVAIVVTDTVTAVLDDSSCLFGFKLAAKFSKSPSVRSVEAEVTDVQSESREVQPFRSLTPLRKREQRSLREPEIPKFKASKLLIISEFPIPKLFVLALLYMLTRLCGNGTSNFRDRVLTIRTRF